MTTSPTERAELIESLNGKSGSVASGPIVTVGADYVSAISAVLKGEMNLGAKMSPDLVFGIMWSEYSGVLPMNSKKVPAEQIDAKPGSPNSYCYQIVLAGLKPDKTYYFRSYLTQNSEDTYGETKSFTTKKQSSLVETLDATEIIITHAVLNGRIDYASLSQAYENIEYGFYWGVSANRQEDWGCFGGGELQGDTYSAMLNELSSGGQYYYKAYLKLGENVYDGVVKTFTTNRYVNGIMLNKYSLSLMKGDAETIIATITPEDAYDKTYSWSSSNESVVQVDQNGTITAVSEGEAYVRVVANDGGGKSASCYVTVFPEMVDLGLSVKWRSNNMGASKPEEYGDYYAWGETEPKDSYSWSTYQYGTNSSQSKYNDTDNLLYLDRDDDVAQVKLGGGWRMPTEEEFVELKDNCTWTWTTLNNVCGYKVTSKKSGFQSKWIFLPATAYGNEEGEYWSSSLSSIYFSSYARCLSFWKNNAYTSDHSRCMGLTIRPVSSSQDITSVELKNVMNLLVSESETLVANILPTNAINRTLLWSSANTSVATVDQNGKVTAVSAGIARITAKTSNGRYSASCIVYVEDLVSSISFDKSELVIYNGTSEKITATVLPFTSNQSLEWSSDNTSVAEVSSSGVVTGISIGTATITATAKDGSGISQTCRVEVRPKVCITDITLNKTTLVLNEGQTETITANVAPDDAYDKSLTWSSSNTSVATVDQAGKVTAVSKGTATITVTDKDGSAKSASCSVTVNRLVTSITLNKESIVIRKGKTANLWVTVRPSTASNTNVSWSSSNTSVATVSSSGEVTSVAIGTATITVSAIDGSGKSAACQVEVKQYVTGITLDKTSLVLLEGKYETLTVTVTPDNAQDKSLTWTSSDAAVAMVDQNGKVTALSKGTATIQATANDGSGVCASCSVRVCRIDMPIAVDLGLSVKWASFNLGASMPEEYGLYYAWGETEPKSDYSWATYKWCNGSKTSLTKYNIVDNKKVLDADDDVAHVKLGGGWRMPTDAEWTELRNNCTWTWTSNYNETGVAGRIVTSTKNGASIFLPAAGRRDGTGLVNFGSVGNYWSSSSLSEGSAINVGFYNNSVWSNGLGRNEGFSVRPVSD